MNEPTVEKYKCYKCNGRGKLLDEWVGPCYICHGTGELDWVENARGRKKPIPTDSSAAVLCNRDGSIVNPHSHSKLYRKPHGNV